MCMHTITVSEYMKQKLTEQKRETDKCTIITGN